MNHSQRQKMNADMGHAHSNQRSRVADGDPLRVAQAKLLGAQLETQADTIEGVCDTLRAEAQKKQQEFEFTSAERAKQEAQLTKMIQCREQMEMDLETQEQAQKTLLAKVELARQNTHMLAEQYDLVTEAMKSEAAGHQQAQTHWNRQATVASQLRSVLQSLEENYKFECEQLRHLAAEERTAALSEARKCANLESEIAHHAKQVAQTLANDRSHGVKLVSALAAEKEAVAATRVTVEEQRRRNQAAIARLREASDSAKAEEQRNLAELAEFEKIGREFQALTAQYETGQSALAQTKSQLRTERAEVSALTAKLHDVEKGASAATEESFAVAKRAAESHLAAERADQDLRLMKQLLRDKEAQCEAVDRSIGELQLLKEGVAQEVAVKRAEEEKQLSQLNERESFLDELLALYSGITTSQEEVGAALARKAVECDHLQEKLHDKKARLENAAGEKAESSSGLEAVKKELTTAQTARAEQATLLTTAQESLRASNADWLETSEQLVALQTLHSEQCARIAVLSSTLTSALSTVTALKSELVELEEIEADRKTTLGQIQPELAELQTSLEQLVQQREAAFERRQSAVEALEVVHSEIEELAKEKDLDALKMVQQELQAKDKELDTKQAELERSRVKVSEVEEMMAAIQAVHSDLEKNRQDCGAELMSVLTNVEAAEEDVARQLAVAERESLTQERANAERRAEEQRQKLVAQANALDLASAQERARADARDLQLASASEKNVLTASQRAGTWRRLEADIEHEQVASIRLKRLKRVAKARVKKLEKAIAGANEKEQMSLQLQKENVELEKQITSARETLEQQKTTLSKEMKFLEKLNATRAAEKRALKLAIQKVEESVNNLLVEAGQTPKSCLKSPKSPDSPSEFKRVTFSSQSEVKMDSQLIQKIPTKRTSKTTSSQKSKKARTEKSRAASPKSPAKRSISPKSNPFTLNKTPEAT